MRVAVLGSGSSGNSMVVESGSKRLLVDAGFSCRELERRLALLGLVPADVDALVLTHEHGDHSRGADRFVHRHGLPLLATRGTFAGRRWKKGVEEKLVVLRSGGVTEMAGFRLEPFAIPHDAREPVGFVIEDEAGHRLGLVADLGSRSRLAWGRLRDLDMLILETNHDLEMLRNGPYPWSLKQRVAGRHGHLSNHDAAQGIPELVSERLQWVVLYHLSRTNNLPALALAEVQEQLVGLGSRAEIRMTSQDEPSAWWEVTT